MSSSTTSSRPSSLHGVRTEETAVPILKVMRLQSPELGSPTAGSLESSSLLENSMALPDSFGVIHVGETFTAYLGALNVSKENFVRKLTVTAQLQTPSGRPRLPSTLDAGNAQGGVDVAPGRGVDAIVSRALEEAGQHILRVEVGYGTAEGSTKTLRKFYRFNVSSPLKMEECTTRAGDAACFCSILVENISTGPSGGLTISSVDFDTPPGLIAEHIGRQHGLPDSTRPTAAQLWDACGRLEPGESFRYLFHIKTATEDATLRGIAKGDDLGKAVFTWRKSMGEAGKIASSHITCPQAKPLGLIEHVSDASQKMRDADSRFVVHASGLSVDVAAAAANRAAHKSTASLDQILPVTVEPVDPPTRLALAVPTEVQFLVVNHSTKSMNLQLQMRLTNMSGVAVCGRSYKNLGEIPPSGGSCVVAVRFMALVAGLSRVQGCCVVELTTGQEIVQPPLFNVFVENQLAQQ